MIKIEIKTDDKKIKEIIIIGHACYDKVGKDIVCSAVSSIVITTVNAIEMFDSKAISCNKNNDFDIKIIKHDEIIDKLILNMINLLKELEVDYPKNVKIL